MKPTAASGRLTRRKMFTAPDRRKPSWEPQPDADRAMVGEPVPPFIVAGAVAAFGIDHHPQAVRHQPATGRATEQDMVDKGPAPARPGPAGVGGAFGHPGQG